ncbi:MAG: hypothetical protein EOO51_06795 [Flavobacterium sp.]|nr:MAG: hypothetical protein EOO51_06795 [Flavobacterium sp.]
MKKQLYILLLAVLPLAGMAQQNPVATSVDTLKNKIGAQFNLTLKVTADTSALVTFPSGKTIGPMEVIRNYKIDTLKKGSQYELVKKYGITQFDSGKYLIPPLKVVIGGKQFLTDSLHLEVSNVKVDTLKQKLYDIKGIIGSGSTNSDWWKYFLIALFIAIVGVLVYRFVKNRQQKKEAAQPFKSPIEKAATLLQQLEKKELWQKGEVKNYYSELTDIARNYIEEAIQIPAMESTTSELLLALRSAAVKKNMSLSPETVENLEKVLRQADLVKFAKSQPLDFEIADDRKKIEQAIFTLDKSMPEENEDDLRWKEMQRQKMLRRQKRNRIVITVGAVVFLLLATTLYFAATRGFNYVKDNIIGHPTKDLLEGDWIASEYGNPGVYVETPKVLKRYDAQKIIPKEAMAMIKEFQMFAYGSMMDNFYILVSTNSYKGEAQIDLNKALDGVINTLELQGAQNILVKQEDFQTREGISGLKVYGTFSRIDPNKKESVKLYYELLLFGQQNGLQQVMIMHEEGDEYGKQVSQRVLNSVEFKSVQQ